MGMCPGRCLAVSGMDKPVTVNSVSRRVPPEITRADSTASRRQGLGLDRQVTPDQASILRRPEHEQQQADKGNCAQEFEQGHAAEVAGKGVHVEQALPGCRSTHERRGMSEHDYGRQYRRVSC